MPAVAVKNIVKKNCHLQRSSLYLPYLLLYNISAVVHTSVLYYCKKQLTRSY